MLTCCIGIMAYNEEANIGRLLDALREQSLSSCTIKDIFIVASGCTDNTEAIVRKHMKDDNRIQLLVQKEREGKSSAINLFLSKADADVFLLISGDTVPEKRAVDSLVAPFYDSEVGMTGGRPVPVNTEKTFVGFAVNLLWRLHHRIAMENPKLGEFVAFRNTVKEIPADSAVDEASIESIVTKAGGRLSYVEDAVIYNKGPENIRDFLIQRSRIAAGHYHLSKTSGYRVSTTSGLNILRHLAKEMEWTPKKIIWTIGAVFMEIAGRAIGYYNFHIRKRNPFIWDIASSTKELKESAK